MNHRPALVLSLALAPALSACGATHGSKGAAPTVQETWRAPASAPEALAAIVALEDARSDGGGLLQLYSRRSEPEVRARAVTALGRLPFPEYGVGVTGAVTRALDDEAVAVRADAAFAIGMRADPGATDAVLAHWDDVDDGVRAALVEAASKLDEPRLRREVLYALEDPAETVRIEAAVGPHRWDPEASDAAEVDSALLRVAAKVPVVDGRSMPLAGFHSEGADKESAEVTWRVLFALQRRDSERARATFLAYAGARKPQLARLYAVKGLARLAPGEDSRAALEAALADADWRIVCEAVRGLAKLEGAALEALALVAEHPSAHVRRVTCEALGGGSAPALPILSRARTDASPAVRAAALASEARIRGSEMAGELARLSGDGDANVRDAVAGAAAFLPSADALPLLAQLVNDASLRVSGTAIESLGGHAVPEARERLRALALDRDNGRRLAAVTALREGANEDDLPCLRRAFAEADGDIGPEVRSNALQNAGAIGSEAALAFVAAAQDDPHPHVRRVARRLLFEQSPAAVRPTRGPSTPVRPEPGPPAADQAVRGVNPTVAIVTNRGTMEFELFPEEAPIHVWNLLELARRDHYDGLTFHRVVPDFVIQGGCYRGDGNGSVTWRSAATAPTVGGLRHEIGTRKYVRGSLGMPRNEDMESGGSQFFVTHRPTPHLDGRYTIFGELREGFDVLDAIEPGDRVFDVSLR